jgi:hypothetical protein
MAEVYDIVAIFSLQKRYSVVYSGNKTESIGKGVALEGYPRSLLGTVRVVPFVNVLLYPFYDLGLKVSHS